MNSLSVKRVVRGFSVEVSPASPGDGLTINNIPVKVCNVIHYEFRVDMRYRDNYAFIVEHPIGALRLFGIRDAFIRGIKKKWDFFRPEDRYAYSLGLEPNSIVGPPDGTVSGGIVEKILQIGVDIRNIDIEEYTVKEKVKLKFGGGYVMIEPAPAGYGVDIRLWLGNFGPLDAHLDLREGLKPKELIPIVGSSTTPFLIGEAEIALYHSLGDLLADITGVGGIDDAYIEAKLTGFYHRLTIGAVKSAEIVPAK